jgi:hypothetical protein
VIFLILVLFLLWRMSPTIRYFLRRYMPTNIALDAIRTRRGLKWGVPAMLLAVPYLFAVNYCTTVIEDGGPGWLNLLVLLFCWNALKFLIMGPVSVVLLIRARVQEALERHRVRRMDEARPVEYAIGSVA